MVKFLRTPASGSRIVNALVLLILSVLLYAAFAWQFYINQTPCSPCFLQRLALVMVGAGLWLNVRIGPSPLRYAMATVAGLAVSFWQVVGISLTGQSGYGATLMGWQVDTWAVVAFGVLFSLAPSCWHGTGNWAITI
jgi:disulfide bond formation protein DsbB